MEIAEHVDALRHQGELLAEVAAAADLETPVPTCPRWRMRHLLRHLGGIHRWATVHVAEARRTPIDDAERAGVMAPPADDDALVDWFREGHAKLIGALEAAPPDLECWSFLPAPSPLAFWARRQAHETAIHRADAQSHGGQGAITPYDPAFAADGVDELLLGFASRRRRPRPDNPPPDADPATFGLRATDVGIQWLARIGPERVEVTRDAGARGELGDADSWVSGPASDLYLLLWNRRDAGGLQTGGDPAVLDLWRRTVQVRWG
jgi:uncharacterized protein (TIGR03083 family)